MTDHRDDLDVALAYVAALGGDDPAAVVDLVSDGFRNEHHAELGSGCVGRDEYARRLPGFFATFANRHYDVVETSVGILVESEPDHDGGDPGPGSEVIVRYRFGADVDRTRIDIPGVMWISVRGGRVSRRLDCWDSLTFHRQTGTAPTL
ncbi:MAG: nuclear transport factor 2 family protein [Ilumatobacter sp.]|uniref:nuclear transport factor 2 family protein n=1 Tax=Ilumatobacter sp. TaxID=1967498 RepID=UPI0032970697